jgi:hypothetical protein
MTAVVLARVWIGLNVALAGGVWLIERTFGDSPR